MSGRNAAALSDTWEREYAAVRDAVMNLQHGDDQRLIEVRIKDLENALRQFSEEMVLSKRTKIAQVKKSLFLRQAESYPVNSQTIESSSTEQILEQTQRNMRGQDSRLDNVSRDLSELRDINTHVGQTASFHARLLDDIDAEANGVSMSIQGDTRRVKEVAAAADTRNLRCAIFILVLVFILLLVFKM